MPKLPFAALLAALSLSTAAIAQTAPETWTVKPEWVRAHESFLASDALQGRGSATRDEAIAAAYVAARFEGYGLRTAPGMSSYLQKAEVVRYRLEGAPVLKAGRRSVAGVTLLSGSGKPVGGRTLLYSGKDPAEMPAGDVVVATSPDITLMQFLRSPAASKVKLLVLRESDATREIYGRIGNKPRLPAYLKGSEPPSRATVITLPAKAFDKLARKPGRKVALTLPGVAVDTSTTTNAIGYLPGSDPKAGVLLLSAHLDHLGLRPDGTIMPGANDDASGTTAVLELAHALAAGKPMRRGILFVAYGSEEIGGYGSRYFAEHPPVPLSDLVANIEIEMIGAQDPKLPAGYMMMTGFDRSTLGETLKAQGALVTGDPYPEEHFFERSDNYGLALKGVVAHTISGWATTPTYHQPSDTLESLDVPFMARAIQSLIAPLRRLADSDARPAWKPGGKPE
jgi:aminopeptidase YwaD